LGPEVEPLRRTFPLTEICTPYVLVAFSVE